MIIDKAIDLIEAVKRKKEEKINAIVLYFKAENRANAIFESDNLKNVFWVNIYNAFFQIKARENSHLFTTKRNQFFKEKQIEIFGLKLSFDNIEHGILRRSKMKFGLGFITKIFIPKWERDLRVEKPDFRIHFVLNCGAESCPMIYPLTIDNREDELNSAMKYYLQNEVKINTIEKKIELNQLFLFYIGDFGGRKGLRKTLTNTKTITENEVNFKWKFTPFDKTLKLDNFN